MLSELLLVLLLTEVPTDGSGASGQSPEPASVQKAGTPAAAPKAAATATPTPEPALARDAPDVKKKQNPHVPTPFGPNTTNPSLDASRSTVIPDRAALPQEFQDIPLAPLGPAPPDVTPTQEGSGARRVNEIKMPSPNGEGR